MIYDSIIIGSGPAGLTAAIYAKRAELNTLVIEKAAISGGQIINTYEIDNYPGFPGISGFDLSIKFREHADKFGASFVIGEVTGLRVEDNLKIITVDDKTEYRAKTVIIATGGYSRRLGVPGENELTGMGVSYCATCDGAFFRNKTVAVVGGGDVAIEDAVFLARICKKVYVIHRRDQLRAFKNISTKLFAMENVTILWDSVVEQINGDNKVESINVRNKKTDLSSSYEVDGVFIAVGYSPNSDIYKSFVPMDDKGYLIAGENCITNIPGIFVAGDIRTKELRQIITAAADGANAVTAVERYLNEL
ncbi:MAG: thioredoxin-disulfide reductase [Mobilitalea sp.]